MSKKFGETKYMIFSIKYFFKQLLIISVFSPLAVLWILKAFLIDWIAGKLSYKKLPKIASEIGLKHIKSEYIKEFGELKGNINGHTISVLPFNSMNPVIRVNYRNRFDGLEIAFGKPTIRLKKNIIDFKTSDRKFNKIFKTIRAQNNQAEKLKENCKFIHLTVSFYTKYIFKLETLSFSNDDIFCSLKYGFNFFPFIPVSKLEPLVKELIQLAEQIDITLKK
ncbi:MAG: hypothetical protein GXO80_04790 [Chlorobi bacterium]|nr:hypothetical protein [Chlorobiota bacterium]